MKRFWWILVLIGVGVLVWYLRRPDNNAVFNPFLGPLGNLVTGPVELQVAEPSTESGSVNMLSEHAREQGFTQEDVLELRQGLAASFEMAVEDIQLTIERDSTQQFATGYVNVGEADRGGIYFAANTVDGWQIVHNGIGIITCYQVDLYNFPVGLVPRCYNPETGESVDRSSISL